MSEPTLAANQKAPQANGLDAEAQAMPGMQPPAFQPTTSPSANPPKVEVPQLEAPNVATPAAKAPQGDKKLSQEEENHELLMSGALARFGDYTLNPFSFKDPRLDTAFRQIRELFELTDAAAEQTPADTKRAGGDSPGKDPDDVPGWVQQLTKKLTHTYPNAPGLDGYKNQVTPAQNAPGRIWNEDATKAQRVLEAFYQGWNKQQRAKASKPDATPEKCAANVEELFGDIGSSKQNKRAQHLGETPSAIFGWCGPASAFGVAISLMRKGFRFKTPNGPKMPNVRKVPKLDVPKEVEKEPFPGYNKNRESFIKRKAELEAQTALMNEFEIAHAIRLEIDAQGAHFLTTWAVAGYGKGKKDKGQVVDKELAKRQVTGKAAHTDDLRQGDYISIIMKDSPISGHVATVVREEKIAPADPAVGHKPGDPISKIYMVSGNARDQSVRVEVVTREMPYEGYDWDLFAAAGNGYTKLKQGVKNAEREASSGGSGKGKLMSLLYGKIAANKALKDEVKKMFPQGYMTSLGIEGSWYKAEVMRPLLVKAGFSNEDLAQYDASLNPKAIDKIKAANAAKDEYKDKWAKDDKIAVERNEKIKPEYGEQKQATPLDPGHAWVVSIVRSSDLDANRIQDEINAASANPHANELNQSKLPSEILAKYGLEKIPDGYDVLFNQAMAYWEPRGGFK